MKTPKLRNLPPTAPGDRTVRITLFILLGIGLLMIASAGVSYANVRFGDPYYFLKEQLLGLAVGLLLLALTERIYYGIWKKLVVPIFFVAVGLLILVFIPGVGTSVYGAARWINLGPFSFQPSEIMKLAIILYLAAWLAERGRERARDFFEGLLPFVIILSLVGFLILKQPDTGTLGVIFLIALVIFFTAGASFGQIFGLLIAGVTLLLGLIKLAPYRMQRFLVFLNPEHDPLGAGYHVNQALLAIGSGGLWGVGLGHSRQKFNYLPEPVTDSIFAILAEETGFLGIVVIISLFLIIAWRGLIIAQRAPDRFGELLAVGITAWVVLQAFVNIGSVSGLIPLTGITLPFVSFGGTSLAVLLAAMGILLNISKHSRLKG